jgi:hypothetical protein
MTNSISVVPEGLTMQAIFSQVDLLLRILTSVKKVVLIVGTSRIGKSTIMNHLSNAGLVGVKSKKKKNQVIYELEIPT